MSTPTLHPPEEGDYAPFARVYVEAARAAGDPRLLLHQQLPRLRAAIEPLSDEEGLRSYEPGKWSVKDVLGHVADTERIFAYRLLRIARGDATPLPGFEQEDYVRAALADRRPLASLLADFEAARAATIALVEGLDPGAIERRGISNGAPVSVRALLFIIPGHAEHHLRVLREKYGVG